MSIWFRVERDQIFGSLLMVCSEARRSNATLRSTNLDDPLAPVVKANGEESALAPQTLRQLFSYDSKRACLFFVFEADRLVF